MHHLLAYTKSMAAGSTNEDITGVTDAAVALINNHYIFDRQMFIWGAYVQGATITRARINSPAFRLITLPRVTPIQVAALPGDLPPFCDWRLNPPLAGRADEVAVESSNGAGAPERHWAGLWVSDQLPDLPRGNVYTILATGATAVTANVWSACPLTFESTLPGGRYDVVGMRGFSATGVFARLILPGQNWRGGCICGTGESQDDMNRFRQGMFGTYGSFDSFALPQAEFLCTGADAAQTVYLDVIKRQ